MADLQRLPTQPSWALHLTSSERMALYGGLWTALNDGTPLHSPEPVRDLVPAILLALEPVYWNERAYRELESLGAPLPPDGHRQTHVLSGGPCDGYRVYVDPVLPEVKVWCLEQLGAGTRHRYVRNPDNPNRFGYTPEEDM
ncbi:hypothetical protein Q8791_23555 [Nocardiopsis sp. CT-R113]|uniref:Uncharacterized protein n=1 Tax=Nocardiopsis codii TaxID=3065942 RepID=A0ABU7KD83_9ACTN|nr:hypothetical protein [Nocardiopsis sp. CT-R113]MEE2040198.1 hypothetical protein [Nocardiopsis sp. CT-R113]